MNLQFHHQNAQVRLNMKYLFGPVNSRRLGISLGIDLLPLKTCSLNCIYCECGRTTNLTKKTAEYAPADKVIDELNEFLKSRPKLDVITFAGSGEPTLHTGIKKIITFLKKNYPEYKIAVLTNSTLFYKRRIRKSVLDADIIIPSLDAVSRNIFNKINRPAKGITVKKILKGLLSLRKEFKNTLIIEIFIIPGINDSEEELSLIKEACIKIAPDKIQLNSLDRPGAENWIKETCKEKMQKIKLFFEPLKAELAAEACIAENAVFIKSEEDIQKKIISTISRRPSTIADLSVSAGENTKKIKAAINKLADEGIIEKEKTGRGTFYKIKKIKIYL